ncbi:disulfide bond formation protein B [Neisseria weaveri]|uniref:Disulfide bond formation protein n=1 Tax=Neisseria weaveri TaxID=28091 RepID=A0A448VP72_9NEIS|nr:disulfide bond formation protein B [Neisseria weaveri]EGV34961.1 disulfide bond formation protein DsbB [Neisseria weaveri ATCC 51223]EGV37467.1 disulfide bond formation protein DsbB [Neisseria weaveri LMG 5135]VEJ51551.1 disulfide bond formation protein [Neisseria weaveri]
MALFQKITWLIAALSAMATASSFASQYLLGMNPCVLCILQRLMVMSVGIAALVVLMLAGSIKKRLLGVALISVPAVYGIGVAVYQLWLQSLPPGAAPACGAPWTFRLRDWPLFEIWEPVVRGFGDCAVADYFLGVPLPVWSVLYFSTVLLLVWYAFIRSLRR